MTLLVMYKSIRLILGIMLRSFLCGLCYQSLSNKIVIFAQIRLKMALFYSILCLFVVVVAVEKTVKPLLVTPLVGVLSTLAT